MELDSSHAPMERSISAEILSPGGNWVAIETAIGSHS